MNDPMNDLVDRYLWAVSRRLPEPIRADVTDELRATIADMVEAHGGREGAVRAVLIELGDPAALARGYDQRPRYLIGPAFYDDFMKVLTSTLVTVLPLVLVALTVIDVGLRGESLPRGLLHAVPTTLTAGLHVVFWTGLVFVLAERGGVDRTGLTGVTGLTGTTWDPDGLPAVPTERQIGLPELVWGLAVVVVSIGWLPWQHVRGVVDDRDGDPVPLLDPALWDGWIPAFIALMLAGGVMEVVKYRVGRWTLPLTLANAALDAVLAAYLILVLTVVGVENPAFAEAMRGDGNVWEPRVVGTVVLVTVLALCVWDVVASVRRHLQVRDAEQHPEATRPPYAARS